MESDVLPVILSTAQRYMGFHQAHALVYISLSEFAKLYLKLKCSCVAHLASVIREVSMAN